MTNSADARPDELARWVEEGGRGPEPDRSAGSQSGVAPRSPLPWILAAGLSGAGLLAFLRLRTSRSSGGMFGRMGLMRRL